MTQIDSETSALRARQRSRNRALGLVLVALAALFFAITIVKIGSHAKQLQEDKQARAASSTQPAKN
ncbi:cytochrome oxidase small assembly protein [Novosphingobium sp.]|uniref:cytochrome oxidase small assembly protein n=1 Tax=Novosphingobium sp. TaxID=1874826 RepID=UPI0025F9E427|nr:cytochrome oxidase small assembly protein [Novosphingobium sp.]